MRWPRSLGLLLGGPWALGLSQQFLLHIFHRTLQPTPENIAAIAGASQSTPSQTEDSRGSPCPKGWAFGQIASERLNILILKKMAPGHRGSSHRASRALHWDTAFPWVFKDKSRMSSYVRVPITYSVESIFQRLRFKVLNNFLLFVLPGL